MSQSSSTESHVNQLRQQLILDQVLIMELEDQREEIAPQLKQTAQLLAEAQTLAEKKTEEAEHIAKVREDLQRQYEHLQHIQHVTNSALEETRHKLTREEEHNRKLLQDFERILSQVKRLEITIQKDQQTILSLQSEQKSAHEQISRHIARIAKLDSERRTMKSSRSWRWTTWLRAIERHFS